MFVIDGVQIAVNGSKSGMLCLCRPVIFCVYGIGIFAFGDFLVYLFYGRQGAFIIFQITQGVFMGADFILMLFVKFICCTLGKKLRGFLECLVLVVNFACAV